MPPVPNDGAAGEDLPLGPLVAGKGAAGEDLPLGPPLVAADKASRMDLAPKVAARLKDVLANMDPIYHEVFISMYKIFGTYILSSLVCMALYVSWSACDKCS
jgi:hypothetical protein